MLRLDALIVKIGEWRDIRIAYAGDHHPIASLEFDLGGYREPVATAVAKEIVRLAGDDYSNYPLDNVVSYIRNVIEESRIKVRTNIIIVKRVEIVTATGAFPANDESRTLVIDCTVVFTRVD